jgi:hypothetical protein
MSYDLMVFEKTKAPRTKAEFMKWYDAQVQWNEEHDYQTPSVSSPALQNWYHEFKNTFPPINGIDALTDEHHEDNAKWEDRLTDYCIGKDVIYAAFAWSIADEAYELMKELAKQHDVGFFDVSAGDGDIILPDGKKIL